MKKLQTKMVDNGFIHLIELPRKRNTIKYEKTSYDEAMNNFHRDYILNKVAYLAKLPDIIEKQDYTIDDLLNLNTTNHAIGHIIKLNRSNVVVEVHKENYEKYFSTDLGNKELCVGMGTICYKDDFDLDLHHVDRIASLFLDVQIKKEAVPVMEDKKYGVITEQTDMFTQGFTEGKDDKEKEAIKEATETKKEDK